MMKKSHVAGWTSESPTPVQLKEFFAQLEKGRITKSELQSFLRGENRDDIFALLNSWQTFYRDVFGIEADFSNLQIQAKQKDFDRLIVVAQGMTPQWLYDKCKELFPCRKWTDKNLDEIVISDRTAKDGPYVIWVRNRVEADEELKNLSANQLRERDVAGITLEERLVYEIKYFKETERHMDIDNWTLCTGSRYDGGGVPLVSWGESGGGLLVYWCDPDNSTGRLRSRAAVSLVA